ncbi:low temperature requirement protein A [Deinococcus ruber]|uniref:Low temperature requirement protein A n=1 Tax=Deinococcus ruber TaxID=1848197 RepID=A0A918C4W0_9DEIO|nr:low temperature requirement protein A [Deinococcus ruber]GGR03894.1 hypothetical protein GCM10008957_16060 [Deinococcus ruber]
MSESRLNLWERPTLRTDEEHHIERKVSWLELFYDLVFVVVIAQLAHDLASHLNGSGLLAFVLLFIPAWWMWVSGTVYNERFETQDLSYRLLVFLQMLVVSALAIFAHGAFGETSAGFALSYAAGRALVVFMWGRAGWYNPQARPVTNRYVLGFSTSILLWVASVFVPPPLRFILWAIGLVVDIATPILTIRQQRRLPRYSSSKLPERMGLFVLIVLGESVVSVVSGLSGDAHHLSVLLGVKLALGIGVTFGLWWVYFDFVSRRPPKPTPTASIAWTHLHLLLLISLIVSSAVNLNILQNKHATDEGLHWWLSGAFALSLISMGLLQLTLSCKPEEQRSFRNTATLKFAVALITLVATALLPSSSVLTLYPLLLVGLLAVIVYGLWAMHSAGSLHDDLSFQDDLKV